MGALADLLHLSAAPLATPATPATLTAVSPRVSQLSQDSQGLGIEMRPHLLRMAAMAGLPASVMEAQEAADLAECVGLPDATLRAWLSALDLRARMDAGDCPPCYTQAAECSGCGPVLLWPGSPAKVIACPWCFRRRAGKPIPRPSHPATQTDAQACDTIENAGP